MNLVKHVIIYYLTIFMIGCGAKPPVTVEKAREMETQIIYGNSNEVLKASMNVLQDMYYSIDDINSDMGLLIATKNTEEKQAEIRKEQSAKDDTSLLKKILVGVFVVTIIGGLMLLLGNNNQDHSSQNESSHHHSGYVFNNDINKNGEILFEYKITINTSEYGVDETKLRISAVGQKIRGDEVIKSGPIHDIDFYQKFFKGLNQELGY